MKFLDKMLEKLLSRMDPQRRMMFEARKERRLGPVWYLYNFVMTMLPISCLMVSLKLFEAYAPPIGQEKLERFKAAEEAKKSEEFAKLRAELQERR